MSERKEADNMSGSDTVEPMETDQTEQPQNATEDSTNPTQVQASHMFQSDIKMDVQLHGQQGQHQYPMGNSSNQAQNNFSNPHPSAGQFPQAYQSPTVNMPNQLHGQQGQHQCPMGNSSNPAQNNFTNPHPSARQFPQPYQFPTVNMPNQGQHLHAMGGFYNPAQSNCINFHPSAGQFPHVPQNTSMNTEVQGQHQCAAGNPSNPVQNICTNPHPSDGQFSQTYQNPSVNTLANNDEVRATLFVQWSDDDKLQKKRSTLQKVLQTLVSKSKFNGDCDVLNVSEDGRAEIKIKPAAAVTELMEHLGKPLTTKDGKTVKITDVSMTLPELDIQTPDKASMNHPPSSVSEPQHVRGQFGEQSDTAPSSHNVPVHTEDLSMIQPLSPVSEQQLVKGKLSDITASTNVLKPTDNDNSPQEVNLPSSVSEKQNDQEPPVEQSGSCSSAAASKTEEKTCCVLPVAHFWYVKHIFKEDIERIERRHGVKMNAEANVSFVGNQKDEGLKEAQSEFTDLVQKCLGEFDGSVTPLKSVDTEEFKDALKMIQRPENKLLVSLSSDEMTIYGPKPIPTAISKSLNAAPTSSANTYNSAAESLVRSLNIGMSINDCLVNNGLNMQESHWKLMTASYSDDVDKIKKKFSVDFKDSVVHHGKVNVKAHYKRSGGNASMESHAVRALLHLCQKIATSPKNITQHRGATGFSGSTKNSSSSSEGPSNGPVVNSQSEYSTRKTEESAGEGATAGDNKDEECPICKDTFKNKKQLKCKHEFCEECLEESKKHMGPVCPVCKDVFGVLKGTQPDGTMSSYKSTSSLPGFDNCGTIVIDYHFPSGKQTERHPNPGQLYHGTSRTAYLPDNKEGKEVLGLLKKAFDQKLVFTVGTSTTSGIENQVTWNDIHHKTSMTGGPQRFGYPDADYLRRVRDELKAKGIE